jgi:hypothetical protein
MRAIHLVLLGFVLSIPVAAVAQSEAPALAEAGDSAESDSVAPKKNGMFGKVKGLARNKVVRQVAKAALCTAVPGGQVIAGAIDAAETKDVAGAAATAATGGGSNCMPGMAGQGLAGAAGAGAGAVGTGLPGQPVTGMPGMAMSPEQMKQMQDQYQSMGMDPAQMQQVMAGMAGAPGADGVSEGPSLTTEKGRLVLRDLPWVQGSERVLQGSEAAFGQAVRDLAQAILATSGTYRIEARVEDQGGKKESRLLASRRAAAVLSALTAEGVPAARLETSDGGSDKDPRIVVSKAE